MGADPVGSAPVPAAHPLRGRRVVVTRASRQAASLSAALAALGADVLEIPVVRVEWLDAAPLGDALARIREYDWVVLTSQNAVQAMWRAVQAGGLDAGALAGPRYACVGRGTSDALLACGIHADVVPQRFVAEAVLEALASRDDVRGSLVLYVAATGIRSVLPDGLARLGCTIDIVTAYRTISDAAGAARLRTALDGGTVDVVTLASASAVRGVIDAVGPELARRARAVSIGPITSAAARAAGMTVAAEATEASVAGLARAVIDTLHYPETTA